MDSFGSAQNISGATLADAACSVRVRDVKLFPPESSSSIRSEADSLDPVMATRYRKTLPSFARALRKVIHDAGVNLYDSPDKIPFVQPKLPSDPWELDSATMRLTRS